MPKRNIGGVDRVLRIVVGLTLLSLVFFGPRTLWGLLGLIPLATALIGNCPAYLPLGFSTCRTSTAAGAPGTFAQK
jgi:hypothetical protein